MKAIDAIKLKEVIETTHGANASAFKDLFALGCWLHMTEHQRTGHKLVRDVLKQLPEAGHKMYFAELLENLGGHERQWAAEVHAHLEVNELFE